MTRRGTHFLALLVTATSVAAGAAGAQSVPAPVVAMANDIGERQASGQIELAGGGLVSLTGRLTISANLPSRGVLRLVDRDGDASVHVAGRQVRFSRSGRATVRRAGGIVFASGSNLVFQVTGGRIELSAAGIGRANLRGHGRVRVNLGPERAWPRGSITLAPGSGDRERRPDAARNPRRR